MAEKKKASSVLSEKSATSSQFSKSVKDEFKVSDAENAAIIEKQQRSILGDEEYEKRKKKKASEELVDK